MYRIIAIHGIARSGKDELANILCQTYGFTQIAFADKIKEFAIKYFNVKEEDTIHKTSDSRTILQGLGSVGRESIPSIMTAKIFSEDILEDVKRLAHEKFGISLDDIEKHRKKFVRAVLNGLYKMLNENLEDFINIANIKMDAAYENMTRDLWVNYLKRNLGEDTVYIISDLRFRNEKEKIEQLGGITIKLDRTNNPEIEAGKEHISEYDLKDETSWFEVILNEHKSEWKWKLVQSAANLVRKLDSIDFFTEEDKNKFKIDLEEV